MKTAGIREMKAHLSRYLRQVQQGETILITDRGRVVAELHAPRPASPLSQRDLRYLAMVASGRVTPAESRDRPWLRTPPGPAFPKGTAQRLIDEDREE